MRRGPLLALGAALTLAGAAGARQSRALWLVVHGLCVPDRRLTRLPFPCTAVDARGGWAVVRDEGRSGVLLVPTRRLTGIEDPRLLAAGTPNYWRAAWDARRWVEARVGRRLRPQDVGLAINAVTGRTQDQLHIHVNCVGEEVRDAVARSGASADGWKPLVLAGHGYQVRALGADALAEQDPFRLVAADGPPGQTLATQTMALLGRADPPGFFLLTAAASPTNRGHAEELLDHGCTAAG